MMAKKSKSHKKKALTPEQLYKKRSKAAKKGWATRRKRMKTELEYRKRMEETYRQAGIKAYHTKRQRLGLEPIIKILPTDNILQERMFDSSFLKERIYGDLGTEIGSFFEEVIDKLNASFIEGDYDRYISEHEEEIIGQLDRRPSNNYEQRDRLARLLSEISPVNNPDFQRELEDIMDIWYPLANQ